MSEPQSTRADRPRSWPLGLVIGVVALLAFGIRIEREPIFVDESAYVAQTYFLDLMIEGRRDHWAWLEYHAYDLPPLPKYLIGIGLKIEGHRSPGRLVAGAWFDNTRLQVADQATYHAGRRPIAFLGALGCVAIYYLGVLARDRRTGVVAAVLLMIEPLYRLHARRAMSDVPAEALILAALAAGLWIWRSTLLGRIRSLAWAGAASFCGVLAGLAVLSKLNGVLALMVLTAWAFLALPLLRFPIGRRLAIQASLLPSGFAALVTFIVLNPFVTAAPQGPLPPRLMAPAPTPQSTLDRLHRLIEHRQAVSRRAAELFPHDALTTPLQKALAVAVQGFGRFSPLGPRDHDSLTAYPRVDWTRDWSALIWIPWVIAGAYWAWVKGWAQYLSGEPPTSWAIVTYALVALLTVGAFVPLAWDRYFLSIQAGAILLASGAAVAGFDTLRLRVWPRAGTDPS